MTNTPKFTCMFKRRKQCKFVIAQRLYNTVLKSLGQSQSQLKAGPNGDPIATRSNCL